MSATNHTTTIELSQYISTDKPTYLSDYNGDMLKIDNAFASDRDGIATAQNKADTADGKADTNKTAIDGIDAQINGDPSVPSDTGLAGKVNAIEGNVNTINSLIGNGTPTTTNKTIIGAINELHSDLGTVSSETLVAGETDVTFTVPTTGDFIIEFYSSDGSNYTAIDLSVAGSVTLTYDSALADRTISMKVCAKNV